MMETGKRFIRRLAIGLILLIAALATTFTGDASADTGQSANGSVGYIESIVTSSANAVTISRNGKLLSPDTKYFDLYANDQIYIHHKGTRVAIRMLGNRNPIFVTKYHGENSDSNDPDYVVAKPELPGLAGDALAWLKKFLTSPDNSKNDVPAVSRSVNFCNGNDPGTIDTIVTPSLTRKHTYLESGNRAIFAIWAGGNPPFTVTLSDDKSGQVLAQSDKIADVCHTTLPTSHLVAGHYHLTITDSNNVNNTETDLYVVDTTAPATPDVLKAAGLPGDASTIYAATWLSLQDGGKWTFEAVQRVASLQRTSAMRREWLLQWGSPADQLAQ